MAIVTRLLQSSNVPRFISGTPSGITTEEIL